MVNGQRRRLIDEVDLITGGSGGSFTALAYALYGERFVSEYEARFLKRDVQGALLARSLNPFNWWQFIGGTAGHSGVRCRLLRRDSVRNATFGDLLAKAEGGGRGPGTDLSTGSRLAFFQNDFDLLCSDLNKVRLSRAAATSSAVPVVLSPVTFNNYGGNCGFQVPVWLKDVENPKAQAEPRGTRASALPVRCRTSRTVRTARSSTWSTAASRTTLGSAVCSKASRSSM